MTKGNQIRHAVASLVLLCALMLPTVIQISHIFQGHESVICTNQSTHFHNDVSDCQICDFNFTPLDYDIVEYPDLVFADIPLKVEKQFSSLLFHSFKITNTQLRAPPHFLS
ncbi:hypothetical protein [uncultured Eudoraea sp.]|uniref:hypothetical protein n=1 Tax=uncultured Eudoraea sp. TaxID=1035614 RepID=UPI002627BF38|nr:hypothetical protein [uncultured Eudoraea sp.]